MTTKRGKAIFEGDHIITNGKKAVVLKSHGDGTFDIQSDESEVSVAHFNDIEMDMDYYSNPVEFTRKKSPAALEPAACSTRSAELSCATPWLPRPSMFSMSRVWNPMRATS